MEDPVLEVRRKRDRTMVLKLTLEVDPSVMSQMAVVAAQRRMPLGDWMQTVLEEAAGTSDSA